MYRNTIIIGVKPQHEDSIEPLIEQIFDTYTKDVGDMGILYSMEGVSWVPEFEPIQLDLLETLDNLDFKDKVFVRLGEDYGDTEIHGSMKAFNLKYVREVSSD